MPGPRQPLPVAAQATYAGRMACIETRLLAKRPLAPDGAVLTVAAPHHDGLQPFQFYMLSVPADGKFPFLPRPFSVYDARPGSLDFLIKVVGAGTASLARLEPGDALRIAGPLGNGVTALPSEKRAIGVAGGVGIAPFLLLYREWVGGRVSGGAAKPLLLYGARSKSLLYDLEVLERLPIEVRAATDDGTFGFHGRVDALLDRALAEGPAEVLCCGPDPMMEAIARVCAARGVRCQLSLETFMACGYGVCNACAVAVRDERYPGGFRYDRCCVDGPVFDAAELAPQH